jgi:D-inositol-3-phosphate glycosyltransferase
MRILLISDHADPLAEIGSKEAGGQNIYVFYLAKFLSKLEIAVDIFTRWDRKNKKEVVKINRRIRVIRVKAGPKRYMPRDNFLNVIDEFANNLLRRIEKEKITYDIIHTNYWFSGLIGLKVAKKIKKPVVHVYHSIGKIRYKTLVKFKKQDVNNLFFRKRMEAEKEIAHKAAQIISTSPIEKKLIKNNFDLKEEKIKVIPIGVDTKIFKPIAKEKARKILKMKRNIKYVLYVGRIEWRKGIGTLLFAFREVLKNYPKAKLLIIGGGKSKSAKKLDQAERERLKNIAKKLKIESKVFFLGAKKQKSLYKYYSACDVCVVPSYYEPFGIVPIESMACATPVVASKAGGLQYSVIDGKTGYLAKARDYKDFAKKIKKALKNGKNYYKLNCLKRVKNNFSWEKIAKQYQAFFNQLIAKRK